MKTVDYSLQIIWSQEDEAYLAAVPELPGCMADGQTPEEALQNLRTVIADWIEVARETGRHIPKPMRKEDLQAAVEEQAQSFATAFRNLWEQSQGLSAHKPASGLRIRGRLRELVSRS